MNIWDEILGGAAGAALIKEGYDRLGDIGETGYERMSGKFSDTGQLLTPGLAQELQGMMEFQPYTVTSTSGSQFGMMPGESTVDAAGNVVTGPTDYQLSLSDQERLLQDAQIQRAESFFDLAAQGTEAREQDVYNRMRAGMLAEEERQRDMLQQQLQGQGRLGVRSSMFGGTPEQLALAKAQEEAKNQTMLNAMQYAGQEQSRNAQLGTGMLSSGYIPQAQLLNAVQPGMTAAEQRRQAIAEQTKAYGETYASGLDALLQAGLGQANILGGAGANLTAASLGGLFT